MAVHLLIVDALNLIRRIHAVQGTPCKDTCLHALEQLIRHSEPTHAARFLMTKPATRAGGTSAAGLQSRACADAGRSARRNARYPRGL